MLRIKKTISLELADRISKTAIQICIQQKYSPVTIVIVDCDGIPIVTKRMDGCPTVGFPQFALAKATTCIIAKMSTRELRLKYTSDNDTGKFCQMLAMGSITENGIAPFAGGILIKVNDEILGAIGVSGAASDEDEYCAIMALEEALQSLNE